MGIILAVFLVLGVVGSSPPDSVPRPNVENFNIVLSKQLEFRVDDYRTAFVGRVVVYQNPEDLSEFVRVYYRQVAIISERAQEQSSSDVGSLGNNSSNLNYHRRQEEEILNRIQQATDAFAFVQWRTTKDLRTGQEARADSFRSWLLEQNGNWTFSSQLQISTMPLSESSRKNPDQLIIVGTQFVLAGGTHILRIDQDELFVEKKGSANDKK